MFFSLWISSTSLLILKPVVIICDMSFSVLQDAVYIDLGGSHSIKHDDAGENNNDIKETDQVRATSPVLVAAAAAAAVPVK